MTVHRGAEVLVRSAVLGLGSILALLAGCGSNATEATDDAGPTEGGVDTAPPTDTCTASVQVSPTAPLAQLGAKVATKVQLTLADTGGAAGPHPLKVVLVSPAGKELAKLLDTPNAESLTGGSLGKPFIDVVPADVAGLAPGKYAIKATLGCPAVATAKPGEAQADLFFARLGAVSVGVGAGDGARVPLMYHAIGGTQYAYYPIDGAKVAATSFADPAAGEADLDSAPSTMRAFPATPWADLDTPKTAADGSVVEDGVAYPVSLTLGTKPDLTFTLGKTTATAAGAVAAGVGIAGAPAVRVAIDGQAATDPATALVDGGAQTIRLAASPVPTIGRFDVTVKWHFEAKGAAGWAPIAGTDQSAVLRFYGVLGNEQGTTAPNLPWVAVVDLGTKAATGKAAAADVRAALVKEIYENFGLKYDRKSGASFYTTYSSGFGAARFDLGLFLKRSRGTTVNCTDCASILSTYTNMLGVKLHYAIIQGSGTTGFSLNPIMGIGSTVFGSPFDSGRMSFNYHAVTTQDSTKTINDATLAVDGDTDPKTAPQTKLLVQDLTGTNYLTRLSPGTPAFTYADQVTTVR